MYKEMGSVLDMRYVRFGLEDILVVIASDSEAISLRACS